jgi:YD repeat-containing protein
MKITTFTLDGQTIAYSYDPEHRAPVITFYDDLVATGQIAGYENDSEESSAYYL